MEGREKTECLRVGGGGGVAAFVAPADQTEDRLLETHLLVRDAHAGRRAGSHVGCRLGRVRELESRLQGRPGEGGKELGREGLGGDGEKGRSEGKGLGDGGAELLVGEASSQGVDGLDREHVGGFFGGTDQVGLQTYGVSEGSVTRSMVIAVLTCRMSK